MKKAFAGTICLCAMCIACFSGCAAPAVNTKNVGAQTTPAKANDAEANCLSFVSRVMVNDGGVLTNNISSKTSGELASGHEVLSESQGLMLCYYASLLNREQYDKTLVFVQGKLDSGSIISYRLGEDGSRYSVNASVDDLRILRGLLEGAEAFSETDYETLCSQYARRLYETNVKNKLLLDFYDENYKAAGKQCTLCYSDLKTMNLLGETDKRWLKVENSMCGIVLDGYLGNTFPLFRMQYQSDTDSYTSGNIRMTESLLTALHLSEVDKCPAETVNWLQKELLNGAVYGEYTEQGKPVTKIESTAIYALCALLGISENKPKLVHAAIDKLLKLQITDQNSELYGAFADAGTGKAYSFDNLMALTALRAQSEFFSTNEGGSD